MNNSQNTNSDLAAEALIVLRSLFFDENGKAREIHLEDKKNTQNDPLDVKITEALRDELRGKGIIVQGTEKPNVSPDTVLFRESMIQSSSQEAINSTTNIIIAIETKAVRYQYKKNKKGIYAKTSARISDMDFNSTPPCSLVRVVDSNNKALQVRCFYLFIVLDRIFDAAGELVPNKWTTTMLALTDGAAINQDADLYSKVTGVRTKEINLGTFGDGLNRLRPMLVFCAPLKNPKLVDLPTLIHSQNIDLHGNPEIKKLCSFSREVYLGVGGDENDDKKLRAQEFYCYRAAIDVDESSAEEVTIEPPFSQPSRTEKTSSRGVFKLSTTLPQDLPVLTDKAVEGENNEDEDDGGQLGLI